jgi:hypothetical protein
VTVPLTRGTLILTAAVLAAVFLFATSPPAPQPTQFPDGQPSVPTIRGAWHIHTTRSDGALDREAVARAAGRAGLQFAVVTDHGDGTRTPEPPAYLHGVLCIDAVEISTDQGHFVALGIPAAPFPLGGDADAVAEDVRRLGGFGVAAHPDSPRPELAWHDWSVPMDGVEWLNADSEWRDEGRLRVTRSLVDYLWRPAGALVSLLDRPVTTLARWDRMTATRQVVALGAHDAHGGLGAETGGARGRRLHVPGYEATFRSFSVHATLEHPPTGNAADDARQLLEAIGEGRVFTAIDGIAGPAALEFTAEAGGTAARAGGLLPAALGRAAFHARAALPPGGVITLLRDGRPVVESGGNTLNWSGSEPGAYRVEVHAPAAPGRPPVPWLLSNPIYRWSNEDSPVAEEPEGAAFNLPLSQPWRAETSPESAGTVEAESNAVTFRYELRPGDRVSQFAALATDLAGMAAGTDALVLRGRADRPMRVSVQLRFANDGLARWRRSIYLDGTDRPIRIAFDTLRPAEGPAPMPPVSRATSLLFVVDLTNTAPGASGSFTLRPGS